MARSAVSSARLTAAWDAAEARICSNKPKLGRSASPSRAGVEADEHDQGEPRCRRPRRRRSRARRRSHQHGDRDQREQLDQREDDVADQLEAAVQQPDQRLIEDERQRRCRPTPTAKKCGRGRLSPQRRRSSEETQRGDQGEAEAEARRRPDTLTSSAALSSERWPIFPARQLAHQERPQPERRHEAEQGHRGDGGARDPDRSPG